VKTPEEAVRRAQAEQKPIFIEIIVGRLAQKELDVC